MTDEKQPIEDATPATVAAQQPVKGIEEIAEEVVRFPGGGTALLRSDKLFHWAQKSSLWPLTFGLACCAVTWGFRPILMLKALRPDYIISHLRDVLPIVAAPAG